MSTPTVTATDLTGRWTVDTDATEVTFRTTAFLGLMKVNGTVAAKSGTLVVDDAGAAVGRVAFDATTIDTGIAKRDAHLGRADFFHAEKWPEATFTVEQVTVTATGATVRGELVIRDAPIRIEAPLTVRGVGDARVVEATIPVDHHAAGLPFRKPLLISGKATVAVRLTLVPA